MKRIFKLLAIILIAVVIICGYSFLTDKRIYTKWEVAKNRSDTAEISWAPFQWGSDSIDGRYVEKTSMLIPCKIEGVPYTFTFQFDLGANLTGIYENSIHSFYDTLPGLAHRTSRLRSPLQFWYNKKAFNDLTLLFGSYRVSNQRSFFYSGYGEKLNITAVNANDTFHLGTIGADLFQDKVLVIDYPNQRFAICDTMPGRYNYNLSTIELDKWGRIILPYKSKGKSYRISFDNGSSLFPIIARSVNRPKFSTNPVIDSLTIRSWGEMHMVDSRMITDTFELANKKYCNVKVYENHSDKGIDMNTDGMTGNYLFWNNTIVIDFKNKKFGIE